MQPRKANAFGCATDKFVFYQENAIITQCTLVTANRSNLFFSVKHPSGWDSFHGKFELSRSSCLCDTYMSLKFFSYFSSPKIYFL